MKVDYPFFTEGYSREELIQHFTLSETEQQFIAQFRGDVNRHGAAVLLKSLQYLGYFPQDLGEIPVEVKLFITQQLNLLEDLSNQYPWDSGTRGDHFARIRQHTGFRFPTAEDKEDLSNWLQKEGALSAITFADLFSCAIQRLRSLCIELPSEKELTRVVHSAHSGFFSDVHHQINQLLSVPIRQKIDQLLIVPEGESFSTFEKVKAPPGPVGVASLTKEVKKLQTLRATGIGGEHLGKFDTATPAAIGIPFKVKQLLFRRAKNETAREMRSHPDVIRYGLMTCFIDIQAMEVIDNIVEIFVSAIHRIDVRSEKKRDLELLKDIKHVDGKTQILFRLSEAIMANPDGTIRDVIFPDEGTNIGIKRIANANTKYSYDGLLYVRKTYFSPEALRNAISAVVNYIFSLRNPLIWGEGNACASDGKRFSAWSQNLMTEWRTRYKGYGVKVYWHIETNAVSIYSQLKNHSASEAAAMIEGLIRHDTQMRVEKNFVDSHGQSEVAFAFCRLLNDFKLMPRLKGIKRERLYLPDTGMAKQFPNLAGVLTRPIRWDIMNQQYDEMMKATVAMKYGDATADAILKRYSSINYQHPTYKDQYKALLELGKVEKTIFLCNYLPSPEIKGEVQAGLNVVENWNGANDFIFYGRGGKFETNNPEEMEISMLCLHLLQNCLILINTILLEQTIEQQSLYDLLSEEDRRAITPLFHRHVNPYGIFELSLEKDSFLEAA